MLKRNVKDLKKVRCKKKYGTYFYDVIKPSIYNDLDAPIYELYDLNGELINEFGAYGDMKYYIETGEYL